MEDKCPFCGAEIEKVGNYIYYYSCGTAIDKDSGKPDRSDPCYERQLAAQAKLIKQAMEVVEATANYEQPYDGFSCVYCGAGFFNVPHQPDCMKLKAQALLPELRKAVEEKS